MDPPSPPLTPGIPPDVTQCTIQVAVLPHSSLISPNISVDSQSLASLATIMPHNNIAGTLSRGQSTLHPIPIHMPPTLASAPSPATLWVASILGPKVARTAPLGMHDDTLDPNDQSQMSIGLSHDTSQTVLPGSTALVSTLSIYVAIQPANHLCIFSISCQG
jgi:hypothetical protein